MGTSNRKMNKEYQQTIESENGQCSYEKRFICTRNFLKSKLKQKCKLPLNIRMIKNNNSHCCKLQRERYTKNIADSNTEYRVRQSKFTVVSMGNTELIFALPFINFCIIFQTNNCKPTFASSCILFEYIPYGRHFTTCFVGYKIN